MSSAPRRVFEVKRRLDGTSVSFECHLVDWTAQRVVVLFRVDEPARFLGDDAAGLGPLDSYGVFWKRRPYNCYYFVPASAPPGSPPVLVRFDLVRDVEFVEATDGRSEVRYVDVMLDLLLRENGPRWEDEDEVEDARRAGLLSASDLALIERARRTLDAGHRRVVAEVRRTLAGLGQD